MALQYETTKEHTITVTGYEGTVRHLVIPDQVDGCPVKTIGKCISAKGRFRECKLFQRRWKRLEDMHFITVKTQKHFAVRQCGRLL